tara:strand:+ start:732 stop:1565 length:834 start_codon:yes stop_codon:yes gene_type:complete
MAKYSITAKQLRTKKGKKQIEGILNSFEIPAAGGASTETVIRYLTYGQTNSVGPNPAYFNWLGTTGSIGDPGSVAQYPQNQNGMVNWSSQRIASSGRGSTTFGLQRGYGQLRLNGVPYAGTSGSTSIPGTITAVDLTFRIGLMTSATTAGAGDKLGIFSAGTGSQLATGSLAAFPNYILAGNKTAYSDFTTISSSMSPNPKEITFSLNSTAIAVMNDQNSDNGELINFAFIWEKDFTGTAPTDELQIKFASGSVADEEAGTPADYFIPKFNITYIPD